MAYEHKYLMQKFIDFLEMDLNQLRSIMAARGRDYHGDIDNDPHHIMNADSNGGKFSAMHNTQGNNNTPTKISPKRKFDDLERRVARLEQIIQQLRSKDPQEPASTMIWRQ